MHTIISEIEQRLAAAADGPGFLEVIFGEQKQRALDGVPVVLYGAGSLGQELCGALKNNGVSPAYFCDSDDSKKGKIVSGVPIISFDDLKESQRDSLIVVASKDHAESISQRLLDNGFSGDRICCREHDVNTNIAFLYSNAITQLFLSSLIHQYENGYILGLLRQDEAKICDAYDLLADQKSRNLFVSKLAFIVSRGNLRLFGDFIMSHSEPFREFGFDSFNALPEDYYYFNNDVFFLSADEVYVDVGAFDGDTIQTFVQACEKKHIEYKHIFALEPDLLCHQALLRNTSNYKNISYHKLGLWSESKMLKFSTSANSLHDQAASISNLGDSEIQVVALDDFLKGEEVTFIKMDPGGNVIPDAVKGAARTIARYRPKLALGAYHAIESIYEIPLLVHSICPDYRLYLRHNTYHPCDTDLYATV